MTINDAFIKAIDGDRRLTIYRDYEKRLVAAQGKWLTDPMMEYRETHGDETVELIGESLTSVTVALKEDRP